MEPAVGIAVGRTLVRRPDGTAAVMFAIWLMIAGASEVATGISVVVGVATTAGLDWMACAIEMDDEETTAAEETVEVTGAEVAAGALVAVPVAEAPSLDSAPSKRAGPGMS